MSKGISVEAARALVNYIAEHGPKWKAKLSSDWAAARTRGPLHALRNTHGPSWLADVTEAEIRVSLSPPPGPPKLRVVQGKGASQVGAVLIFKPDVSEGAAADLLAKLDPFLTSPARPRSFNPDHGSPVWYIP